MINKTPLLIILTLLLVSIASAETYTGRGGIFNNPDYDSSDVAGKWSTATATTKQRAGQYTQGATPLVQDLDGNGTNEIIVDNNGTIEALQYTTSGISSVASYSMGISYYDGNTANYDYEFTPGIYSWGGSWKVIGFNHSDVFVLDFNGTSFNLNQSAKTLLKFDSNYAGLVPYVQVRCTDDLDDNSDHCYLVVENRSSTAWIQVIDYNLSSNTIQTLNITTLSNAHAIPEGWTLHLANIDGKNGDDELAFSWGSTNNRHVAYCSLGKTFSCVDLDNQGLGGGFDARSTDLVVNDMDGDSSNGMEMTFMYSTDGTSWDARTIRSTGVVSSGYYIINKDLDAVSENGIALLTVKPSYCTSIYDVVFYGSDYDDDDFVLCFSQRFGEDDEEGTITDAVNESGRFYIHEGNVLGNGATTLVTGKQAISGTSSTPLTLPTNEFTYPIDYQLKGTPDFISVADTILYYTDDSDNNSQVIISSLQPSTGNSICLNTVLSMTFNVNDSISDSGYCWIEEQYTNGTKIANHSNTSYTPPTSVVLYYTADLNGSVFLFTRCTDKFNTANPKTVSYLAVISDDFNICKAPGQSPPGVIEVVSSTDTATDTQTISDVQEILSTLGVKGKIARAVLWLIIMMIVLFGVIKTGIHDPFILSGTAAVMLVLGWYLRMIPTVAIVIIGLFAAITIVAVIFNKSPGE